MMRILQTLLQTATYQYIGLFIKYYSKLIDTLAAKKLSHYFVSHNIISTKEEEEIIKPGTSSIQAATFLLGRIIKPLRAGFENCACKYIHFWTSPNNMALMSLARSLSTSFRQEVTEIAGKQ